MGVRLGGPKRGGRMRKTGESDAHSEGLPFAFIPKLGTGFVLIFPSAEGETDFFPSTLQREHWLFSKNHELP